MDKVTKESIAASFARMKARRKLREADNKKPDMPCAHCGGNAWTLEFLDIVEGWRCFLCGNRGIWHYGNFIQGGSDNAAKSRN